MLSQFKKYHLSGNPKFNYLGIFQSSKLRILVGKTPPISLKLNFTPKTLGCYVLISTTVGASTYTLLLKLNQR